MIYILVSHKVEDYAKWKQVYDSHEDVRSGYGLETRKIFRSVNEPQNIHVLVSSPSIGAFEEFSANGDLKGAMQRAGVISEPEIKILELA